QVYAVGDSAENATPLCQLIAFERLSISASATTHFSISFPKTHLYLVNEKGAFAKPYHEVRLSIGGGQPRFSQCVFVDVGKEGF
ncbi:MAG TPA: hypothetical protein ENJ56_08475, partial [Anaerolineae bacterium]|nr:hypothetical protein [Anaerolineae bacterium]